ncbi:DNA/RNA non-specific endonuclease [Reichenbachiella agariperforans]|uniref:DNA/RNA non-specific endonuclease n=1 Tax=Reichenbachiella agariperforans TaxID=156994 RepID=UPI001C092B1E|nr:DNA/RNA non-specific endonuclease [Reichenbachiella agariperforans]MBU2912708.1 DNA/RNA non-specific endonuclease [Reichenbachiella agariperforans]
MKINSIFSVFRILFFVLFSNLSCYILCGQVPSTRYKPIVIDPSYEHNKWGVLPSDLLYHFAAYTSSFDGMDDNNGDGSADLWGIPEWVAYEVKAKNPNLVEPDYNRPSKWLTDTEQHALGIVPADDTYLVSGTRDLNEVKGDYRYVRGHMCPKNAADRIGLNAGYNTHSTLNAVPQLQWQNNGIWKTLEQDVEKWADEKGRVWVICGPVFFGQTPAVWLGQNDEVKTAVPDALFKIVVKASSGDSGVEAVAFLIPNVLPKEVKDYALFLTSIDRIEKLTGLDFLSEVDDPLADSLESQYEGLSDEEKRAVMAGW